MIKVEHIETWGFEHAIRGMRNPMNSWNKSDSSFFTIKNKRIDGPVSAGISWNNDNIGPNDLDLMKRLFKAGTEHRKYLRQIFVSMDIMAPLYWWKEFDTYKIGTVENSCSTMHKLTANPIELSDFSIDDYMGDDDEVSVKDCFINVVADCEMYRKRYLETGNRHYWKALIQLLPESYNQKRTVTMNYENVFNIIYQRGNHKLQEWRDFVDILKHLPYVTALLTEEGA